MLVAIPNQFIETFSEVRLAVKREDLIHPLISGNKFRKLKYNLIQAEVEGQQQLLTFGGAFSNHIAAVAAVGKLRGFKTVGVIRGEELAMQIDQNPTLRLARDSGMQLKFISREAYRNKTSPEFITQLKQEFGDFYLVPEGGTNHMAVKGCQEILLPADAEFDFICCAVGTGGTISGLINSAFPHQKVIGFPALKGDFLTEEIRKFAAADNWELILDYHFGGYGKVSTALIHFINDFYLKTHIPLDPIYTGKLVFGVLDLVRKKYFPEGSKILIIHTGGLQGIEGMNLRLQNKQSPLLITNV
ncbi:1-aminocyclopropane-1-carboxylate deaminase/D-cysteine desulfhydrase [Flavobacterium sp. CYK-4]|uniref:1-aminocyclopropane-1-carboxylate deaminase/D-cysteine desulfhydrase n=1 Tax=Flavobacterium lotistagni TaxID=2709660 RepID=UPI0014076151|nr:pyridoxal-phosphate dependent enzyme [Flavobacterium lotistagni]NHM05630.1 1-aminocyclopropane-1-carboxylate deaminase/D-cysteine desulfhydrase [Flavobacterium lotistagni]